MKTRVLKENINTREYFDKEYSQPDWAKGNDGAYIRLQQAMDLITKEYPKHLDVGCAEGTFTKYYLDKFPNTEGWGVDISGVIVKQAQDKVPEGHFQQADCYDLPFSNETFDLVHSAEVLEHLEFPERAIKEMHRVLKSNGTLIVTTPNELADDYSEHLWKWNSKGVRLMLESRMSKDKLHEFKVVEEHPSFHNGHIMYLVAVKQ